MKPALPCLQYSQRRVLWAKVSVESFNILWWSKCCFYFLVDLWFSGFSWLRMGFLMDTCQWWSVRKILTSQTYLKRILITIFILKSHHFGAGVIFLWGELKPLQKWKTLGFNSLFFWRREVIWSGWMQEGNVDDHANEPSVLASPFSSLCLCTSHLQHWPICAVAIHVHAKTN